MKKNSNRHRKHICKHSERLTIFRAKSLSIISQIVLIAVTAVTGYFIVSEMLGGTLYGLLGSAMGLVLGYLVIKIEEKLREIPLKIIIGTLLGITIGLFITNLFISRLLLTHAKDVPITLPIYILLYFVMGYLGFRVGEKKSHTLDLSRVPIFGKSEETEGSKILDTSAIIDGIQTGISTIVSLPKRAVPSRWHEDLKVAQALLDEGGIAYHEIEL